MANSSFENNLSKGSVVKNLIFFALPFLLSNIIQTLYNTVDMIIVGNYSGAACMAGVNIGAQISFVLTNMVMGLCVGGTVLIAQYLTANRKRELKDTIGTLLTSVLSLAVILTVICLVVRKPLISLFTEDPQVFDYVSDYFIVTSLGNIFIFAYNALAAIMRGLGDSKRPLVFVSISCVTNVALDLLFVAVLDMGALGAAIATVISQALSSILCIIHLKTHDFIFDFKLSSFGFKMQSLKMIIRIGLPTSIQNVATGISFLFITALSNGISVIAGSAVGVVGKLNGFAIMPAVALSSSISAVSAQNIGAGEIGRAKKTMGIGLIISMVFSFSIFAIFQLFPDFFLRLFVSSTDPDLPALIEAGTDFMRIFCFDYLLVPFFFSLNGLFIGSGHTLFSLINNCVAALVLRIPFAYFGEQLLSSPISGIGLGAPAASIFSVILCVIFFFSGRWKRLTIIKDIDVFD